MCVIWGIPYLMIRVAVRELAPVTLVFLRTGVAALLLVPFAAMRGDLRPLVARWRPLVAYTAIEVAIPWVVTFTGTRERQGRRRWLGLLVGLGGVVALVGLDVGQVHAVALAEVGCVAVCYAVGPIIFARFLGDVPALGVVAASLVLTWVAYAPFAAVRWPDRMPSAHVVESVLGLAVVCTALAFLLFFALIREVGPVRATVITYVNPAVAGVAGIALLDEHLTAGMVLGFVLVLVGSIIATGRGPEPVPEP